MASSDCYNKALSLLGRRAHFRRQLEEKLRVRRYDDDVIRMTLDRLAEDAYLDDARVAREFVTSRLRRGPIGRRRMRIELEKRGAAQEAVEETLRELFSEEDDLTATREAAARWLESGRRDLTALARHLDRLGFATSSILRVVDEIRSRPEAVDES